MKEDKLRNTLLVGSYFQSNPLSLTSRLLAKDIRQKDIQKIAGDLVEDGLIEYTKNSSQEEQQIDTEFFPFPWVITHKGKDILD